MVGVVGSNPIAPILWGSPFTEVVTRGQGFGDQGYQYLAGLRLYCAVGGEPVSAESTTSGKRFGIWLANRD